MFTYLIIRVKKKLLKTSKLLITDQRSWRNVFFSLFSLLFAWSTNSCFFLCSVLYVAMPSPTYGLKYLTWGIRPF